MARGLGPSDYGDLMFLLGSFMAIRQLLDMGSSSAFYTFLSQRTREKHFFLFYFGWLSIQFSLTFLLVAFLLPQSLIGRIWLGHSTGIILLAFGASFMQNQIWQTISQIAEASRQTVRAQFLSLFVATIHLSFLFILLEVGLISIPFVLGLFLLEYIIAVIWAYYLLKPSLTFCDDTEQKSFAFGQMLQDYKVYCTPLILYSWMCFVYEFGDRWMLQRFGGSEQQGFYQIGYQFAAVSLIATTSILKIFWKEVAEAEARKDQKRVRMLYQKVSRGLLMVGAILSGFMIPWSREILVFFLGKSYALAWPTLAIMFLYPIHQSMGQIGGTMFLATGRTKIHLFYGMIFMLASLPVSYLAQAPQDAWIPGLSLGAFGMALKMVILNVIGVNIMAWLISRLYGWRYDWVYQVVGISSVLVLGVISYALAGVFWGFDYQGFQFVVPMVISGLFYFSSVTLLLWLMPWLVGMERVEIMSILKRRVI